MKRMILALSMLLAACTGESGQFDPSVYGTYSVELVGSFPTTEQNSISLAMSEMLAMGPLFVEDRPGNIRLVRVDNNCANGPVHVVSYADRVIEIDTRCCASQPTMDVRRCIQHALGHALIGPRHICTQRQRASRTDCAEGIDGTGHAHVMAPGMDEDFQAVRDTVGFSFEPSSGDLEAVRRYGRR